MMIRKVKVGADPEVFLYDADEDIYVPVIGFLGGTKAEPKPVSDNGHFVQEDNVMAEFNIPPCTDEDSFVKHIQFTMDKIQEIVPAMLSVKVVPSAEFQEHFLEDPQACISGCDPYSSAWRNGDIEEAVDLSETKTRYAGAHIHIGYDKPKEEKSMSLIKNMDLFLAVPSVLLDGDTKRRSTYGKAGAYRNKPYGVEYRSLSNFWLQNEKLMRWAFNNTMKAVDFTNENREAPANVETIVNNSDKEGAKKLIEQFNIPTP